MAAEGSNGGARATASRRIVFRCHGCAVRFPDDAVGPGTCPRCGAIGGHDRLGRPGTSDGRPGTSVGRPDTSGGRPDTSGGRPGTSDGRPGSE